MAITSVEMNVLLRADIKSRAQWIINGVLWCDVSMKRAEDMNDGPALLNEFLTPTNEWTEAQIANN
jgi:hypothetical protein